MKVGLVGKRPGDFLGNRPTCPTHKAGGLSDYGRKSKPQEKRRRSNGIKFRHTFARTKAPTQKTLHCSERRVLPFCDTYGWNCWIFHLFTSNTDTEGCAIFYAMDRRSYRLDRKEKRETRLVVVSYRVHWHWVLLRNHRNYLASVFFQFNAIGQIQYQEAFIYDVV